MLDKKIPLPVKFFCGLIYSDAEAYDASKKILKRKFGAVDFESEVYDFKFTDYYCREMGPVLYRRFIAFRRLYPADAFARIKSFCIKVEKKSARNRRRKINIDPGYLNEAKLVLTTTKDFPHRIYLGRGIYAEVTLIFRGGRFCDLPTTYPDYRTAGYKKDFSTLREIYRRRLGRNRVR